MSIYEREESSRIIQQIRSAIERLRNDENIEVVLGDFSNYFRLQGQASEDSTEKKEFYFLFIYFNMLSSIHITGLRQFNNRIESAETEDEKKGSRERKEKFNERTRQIFLQLAGNIEDAFDEENKDKVFEELEKNSGRIVNLMRMYRGSKK